MAEFGCAQIGYCGLDKQQLGVGPEGGSLDISSYCAGYVTWDFYMMLLQVCRRTLIRLWKVKHVHNRRALVFHSP